MSSTLENKIMVLQKRLRDEKDQESRDRDRQASDVSPGTTLQLSSPTPASSPAMRRPRQLGDLGTPTRPRRQLDLPVSQTQPPKSCDGEFESKLQEIMKMNGILSINGKKYQTEMKDLEQLGELGNGTCGHVVKMRHKLSGEVIAVKQMRRSGNAEENKRIIMDLDVVLKSHDCRYIVQCLGCFITESDVWICMELMATCLDKLLKKSSASIPEDFLGKVTVATVKALSYLKEKHGVIHRDVKPSNILLDESGCVKLCDFGISGRLVDSKAKTRSAGCAAYMAPERIDPPDPSKPDYDIRADVWSLGITLVELATGVFPYRDCKTDFEVLSRVVQDDPPSLPAEQKFSAEFRGFVSCCLTKNYKHRPKYPKLMEHPFIQKYDVRPAHPVSECQWFDRAIRQIEPRSAGRKNSASGSGYPGYNGCTGYVPYSPYAWRRRETARAFCNGKERYHQDAAEEERRSLSPFARDYSPWRRENVDPPNVAQFNDGDNRRFPQVSTVPQDFYNGRLRFPGEPHPQGSTSPQLLISRFAHQLKQEPATVPQVQPGVKESAKKRFASYVRLRLGSDRAPSPEPPPRLSRGESPLTLRRNFGEQGSPICPRRYVLTSPPQPPPRRLSESCSVPGSPQHPRTRFHYTPELQRRPPL